MNNKRLDQFSSYQTTPLGEKFERRCFLLFAGTDIQKGAAFSVQASLQQSDDPKTPKGMQMNVKFDNLTCEQCSDVIVSITQLVPDFRTVLRFSDLHAKPTKMDLQKRVRYQAALFYLRN